MGLDPGTPGSRPEPKVDAQVLSHPDVPSGESFLMDTPPGRPLYCHYRTIVSQEELLYRNLGAANYKELLLLNSIVKKKKKYIALSTAF